MQVREIRLNAKEHKKFCQVMRDRCRDNDMSLDDLAREIGVSPRSVYNFCSDSTRNPSKFLAAKISNYLGIKPSDYRVRGFLMWLLVPMSLALFIPAKINADEKQPIDFDKYIVADESNVYEEVFGVDYGTDFVPRYYEPIVDEELPITPQEQIAIQKICERHNMSYEFVLALMENESRYDRNAVNGVCKGAMQINTRYHDIDNPYDLLENVEVGVSYLEELFEDYEDAPLVLSVYHGESNANEVYERGDMSNYARTILERSEQLEREHNK